MTRNLKLYSFFLILTSMWIGWTVLVDFFVIRTVFATISNFFEAGDLGIAVFSRLNNLELIVGSSLLALTAYQTLRNKKSLKLFVLSLLCWTVAMFYFCYLTPKLIGLTDLWKLADAKGVASINGISDIQQEHQYFHKIYIGLDSFKLMALSCLLFLGVWKNEEWA